jgi:hypothetical protein
MSAAVNELSHIHQIRLDLPAGKLVVYFFVNPDDRDRWHAWWGDFFDFLLTFGAKGIRWEWEPVQEVFIGRVVLTSSERARIAEFTRTAPAKELAEHRSLGRASRLRADQVERLGILYFARALPSELAAAARATTAKA